MRFWFSGLARSSASASQERMRKYEENRKRENAKAFQPAEQPQQPASSGPPMKDKPQPEHTAERTAERNDRLLACASGVRILVRIAAFFRAKLFISFALSTSIRTLDQHLGVQVAGGAAKLESSIYF
jgi:hypothetical protein